MSKQDELQRPTATYEAMRSYNADLLKALYAVLKMVGGRVEISPEAILNIPATASVEMAIDPATGNRVILAINSQQRDPGC